MAKFKGFKSVEELKRDAYASEGWTPEVEVAAADLLEQLSVPAREFFARMAELNHLGRPATVECFTMVPPAFLVERGLAATSDMGPMARVDAEGHFMMGNPNGSGAVPVTPAEFVLGREHLGVIRFTEGETTASDLFMRYREQVFDALVSGMARALEVEAARRFLGR